jgi:hypothetical protein
MKRMLKFLHNLGGMGVMGALAANLILLSITPEPSSLEEYALMRKSIGMIAELLLLPSLAVVLLSGLLSMAVHPPFHNAGWAWMKLALGVVMFEGTLLSVQGPAERAAIESQRALAGEVDPATIAVLVQGEWGSLWVILGVAAANVALAVWRPRFKRKRKPAAAGAGASAS